MWSDTLSSPPLSSSRSCLRSLRRAKPFSSPFLVIAGVLSSQAANFRRLLTSLIARDTTCSNISIEGKTDNVFTESVQHRFEAYGWQVLTVEDVKKVDELSEAESTR
ncbi:MAG: hypothetical protein ABSA54_00815 [Terriglobales bacterium]